MSQTAGVLDGYVDVEPFAKEVERSPRTILRWMDQPNGLPYSRIGNRRLIHVATAQAWILGRMRNPNPLRPARRGRLNELTPPATKKARRRKSTGPSLPS
jgi:hypothetical protein